MIRVVHTFGRRAGAVEQFDKPVVRFGRAADNDVVFDPQHDRDAGSHHAEVRWDGARYLLRDLQSKNGLYCRGQRVSEVALANGDEVWFGANGPRARVELVSPPSQAHAGSAVQAAPGHAHAHPHAQAAGAQANHHQHPPQGHHHQPAAGHQHAHQQGHGAQQAAQAAPAPPAAGKRVGPKTLNYMIQSAVAAAASGPRRPGKTQEIRLLVDQHVQASNSSQRRWTWFLGCLVFIALSGVAGVVIWSVQSSDDIGELREELADLDPDDPRRKKIEERLGKLHPSNASFGRNLYDRSKKGIFMLVQQGQGFCTAFAIEKDVLATNAHCVVGAKRRSGTVYAVENEGAGKVKFRVTKMEAHPKYRHDDPTQITPDVGIVHIKGKSATVLDVESSKQLKKLGAGDDIYLIGFPGRLMDARDPAATFLAANIGRMTNAEGKPDSSGNQWLIQHDAGTTKGTSGSPIFNGNGKVIGINAGGYLEGDDLNIAGRKTEVVRASPYKFGMRIDLIDDVLD